MTNSSPTTHPRLSSHVNSVRGNQLAGATILLTVIVVAVCGSLATDPDSSWFSALEKPAFMPPDWLFAPVRTLIYALTAVSAWISWLVLSGSTRTRVMSMFAANAALNLSWTLLFFGAHAPVAAAIEILVLLASIIWLIGALWRPARSAAWLLAPYALWVGFASVLTWTLALTNA